MKLTMTVNKTGPVSVLLAEAWDFDVERSDVMTTHFSQERHYTSVLRQLFDYTFSAKYLDRQNKPFHCGDIKEFPYITYLTDVYDVEFYDLQDYEEVLTKLLVGSSGLYRLVDITEEFNYQRLKYYQEKFPDTPMSRVKRGNYGYPTHGDVSFINLPTKRDSSFYDSQFRYEEWRQENPDAPIVYNTPTFKSPEDEALYKQIRADDQWWHKRLRIQK